MRTLESNREEIVFEETEEPEDVAKGFWRRQFQARATRTQTKFDWIFGVILPVVCFTFDPVVFQGNNFFGGSFLETFKLSAYALSFISIMAMAAWLVWGKKLNWLNAPLAGLFAVGGIISLVIGILIAPLSFIGLIFLIGALGFTPLFTSIVYLRNALRAFQAAQLIFQKRILIYTFALSALSTAIVPYVSNVSVNHILKEINGNDTPTIHIINR